MKPEGLAAHLWFLQLICKLPDRSKGATTSHSHDQPGRQPEISGRRVRPATATDRSVVQVRSMEGELQQHAVAGGLGDPAPWLASVSVFIAQFLFGNIPNLPATLASSVENVA